MDEGGLVYLDGNWVERDVFRVAQKVTEFDPNLRVQYLEEAVKLDEPPYRIIEKCKDGKDRIVFGVWQLDDRVLDRLRIIDTHRVDVEALIVVGNSKAREDKKKKQKEQRAEDSAVASALFRSSQDSYSFVSPFTGDLLTIKTDGSVKRESRSTRRASKI